MSRRSLALLCSVLLVTSVFSSVTPAPAGWVTVSPVSGISVAAGQTATAALTFHVAGGYHINSSKPKSDLLIPTQLKLEPPPQVTAVAAYPPGSDFTLSFDPTEKLSVYSGDFAVQVTLSVVRSAPPGRYRVTGELQYQACSDRACFPPKKLPVSFDVIVTAAQAAAR